MSTWNEWRYLRGGNITHAVHPDTWRFHAQCGEQPPRWTDWLGTGDQDEYDRVARLPKCRRCLVRIATLDEDWPTWTT